MAKIRTSFVTNSSSSSFIVIYEIKDLEGLKVYLQDEYGKYGLRLADQNIIKGSNIDMDDYYISEDLKFDGTKDYLIASFLEYSNEGNIEGEDADLARYIPDEFKVEVYNEGE